MTITRRRFLGTLGAAGAVSLAPTVFFRAAGAAGASTPSGQPVLVSLFLRGGLDGLSLVVPAGDPTYHALRPTVAVPEHAVLGLDATFGLHPGATALHGLVGDGALALVPAAGSPHPSKSHFVAQDYMDLATPGDASTSTGWLSRYLAVASGTEPVFAATSVGRRTSKQFRGHGPTIGVASLEGLGFDGYATAAPTIETTLGHFVAQRPADPVAVAGSGGLAVLDELRDADLGAPNPPASWGASSLASDLWQVARLIDADLGVVAATVDDGGWDLHNAMGTHTAGAQRNQIVALSDALAGFVAAMASRPVTVVVTTEFGRLAHENSSQGTDHGRASVVLCAGHGVAAGVHGPWPGLPSGPGDVEVATDWRVVLGEVVDRVLGAGDHLDAVFPGAGITPASYVGVTA